MRRLEFRHPVDVISAAVTASGHRSGMDVTPKMLSLAMATMLLCVSFADAQLAMPRMLDRIEGTSLEGVSPRPP